MITKRQETGMAVISIILLLVAILLLASCSTKKTVTEYIVVHDTLIVGHTDTLRIVSHTSKTDTIREATIQYVTIRQDSDKVDTIKVEVIKDHYHTFYVHDSIDTYKAVADSLRKILDQKESRKEVVKKNIRWQDLGIFFAFIIALLALLRKVK